MKISSVHVLLVQKKRIKQILSIILISILVGLAYPVLDKEFSNPWALFNGFCIGLFGGLAIALHEDYDFFKRLKRVHFIKRLVRNVLLYTAYFAVIIALCVGITYGLVSGKGVLAYMSGPEFREFIFHDDYIGILIYALFFCGLISFTLNMGRKLESRVLFNMISGKYRKPIEEERVFMSIDLNNSTETAEALGEVAFFDFLNKFYFDLTPAIIATNGQVYRYVGDQMIISWPLRSNAENANYLRTYFILLNELAKHMEDYVIRWGLRPTFKVAFHAGSIVSGEIGDIKSQFVFHGKPLHILSLIEKQCKLLGVPVLLSSEFVKIIDLPSFYKLDHCTPIPKGQNNHTIELYTVGSIAMDHNEALSGE